jgi:drug/metabolite transporter superfamily protein YnfA
MRFPVIAWLTFLAAALLEVGGDAVVRKGLRGGGLTLVALGGVLLATYGLVVNLVPWDFSKLLGVYVAIFAAVSVLVGRFAFHEAVPWSTWVGVAVIMVGGLIVQFGNSPKG